MALTGCGGGGGGSSDAGAAADGPAANAAPTAAAAQRDAPAGVRASGPTIGTNLSGMEWARPVLRYGQSSMPNLNFTVPRAADAAYLASIGYTRNRLPIQWELLQPMLHDTVANDAARAAIGQPGEFHAGYEAYIMGVLDAHAAAGITCIVDLHNYCRYQDFVYQEDGSVVGLTVAKDGLVRPWTTDASQVQERIFALAPGATLKVANYTDFWTRAARKLKDHPGFGGYGLMNEPHDLPVPGGTVASAGGEDLTIWPTFAKAAIAAIRAVDTVNPIYVAGNEWQAAMTLGKLNPGWPLEGANLVYEVHLYLDSHSNGFAFDFDTEQGKNFSAGQGGRAIDMDTGAERLRMATDWAKSKGVKLALTEIGMPIDDPRWEEMFRRTVALARQEGVEIYTWMGGNHWPIRNYAINNVPGWHQNRTLEPAVAGVLKAAAGLTQAALFDDAGGAAAPGAPVEITVYARGSLGAPVRVTVASSNGGTFSKTVLTIPAGANGQDSFTFTPAANSVATLTYTVEDGGQLGGQVPPPRKVFSLTDPVAYAATSLADAAMAILAKYGASKWDLADGHTDYMLGGPAGEGAAVRAVADSGYGSSPGNAMEMINWINKEMGPSGTMKVPVMRVVNGRKTSDHSAENTFGFWCKKSESQPGIQEKPKNRIAFGIEEGHFALAAVSVPAAGNTGVVFQASKAEDNQTAELALSGGRPQARWIDANGHTVELTAAQALAANQPAVLAFSSQPGAQRLRVNGSEAGSAGDQLAKSQFNQLLIGWGFRNYYPNDGFGGNVFAVIAGKGVPSGDEMTVLERYLGSIAGVKA
ncbi:cellulase family glycosylhydrolase [Ramlibacter sp.]|uniref:cellulase family glycosylhydrolase n=1 Tax=Ramlibacter sp. TaxID=1917967 RepID=UPI002D12D43B|nr:cellulase family glycosylhydrolase [Ramlibacter sp.]HWI81829.1 cellulase family glycosylhydrolase [Ramlibacter sp.]